MKEKSLQQFPEEIVLFTDPLNYTARFCYCDDHIVRCSNNIVSKTYRTFEDHLYTMLNCRELFFGTRMVLFSSAHQKTPPSPTPDLLLQLRRHG